MSDTETLPVRQKHSLPGQFLEPFHRLRGEMDRLFDEFPARWPSWQLPTRLGSEVALPVPAVEMTEKPESYQISVEVPGIEPDAIDLLVDGDTLVLKGEKRSERDEKEEDFTFSERTYGAFERRIALPTDALKDSVEAKAKNGVLKITVGRNGEAAASRRKIEIKSAKKD